MPAFLVPVALLVFPALMVWAAFSDLVTMRITNRLVLLVMVAFFAMALLVGLPLETIGLHVLGALGVLALFFGFFALGWIGGGDAKLIAATSLWFGLDGLAGYVAFSALLGGMLTLSLLLVRRWTLPLQLRQVDWIERLHDPKTGVPYGIALAAAALLLYPGSVIFQRLLG